ncbi:ATP-dependent DNA helicase PIF1 [Senna tora]|uniref:ATP-dependent DNA helicase PIF1 n=1 Tax=Senna tora TaxID=362788 RepID=A0A834W776_9FABA|nr:ATP-dependent DNA helicase PIF1 [Senna tora]
MQNYTSPIIGSIILNGNRMSRKSVISKRRNRPSKDISNAQDRLDLLSNVFKINLNAFMKDITIDVLFGSCRAEIYAIEFQKCGLSHAHILIWLNVEHKLTTEALIDSVICVEIPDPDTNPKLYEAVKTFIIHDSCGLNRKSSQWNLLLSVFRLPFHLLDEQGVVFADNDSIVFNATLKQTKFLAWLFHRTSILFPPGLGELHYIRLLLTFTKWPTSYEDIKTINGVVHPTSKDGCYVLGLLDNDKEYIIEGSKWSSSFYLHKLFATLLIHNTIAQPVYVWENTRMHLSHDILLKEQHCAGNPDLQLDDDCVKDICLAEIENLLKLNGWSLSDFPSIPMANKALMPNLGNLLMSEELNCRNAHSRFAIPLNIDENSNCHVVQGSDLAELMILPVIPRSTREDILLASLNASYLWGRNYWENIINDENEINIDDDILIDNVDDPIQSILDNTYPKFLDNFHNYDYFSYRAIFSPTLDDVAQVNSFMLVLLPVPVYLIMSLNLRKFVGEKVFIGRMLISHSDSKLPFKFQRHQFPIVLSFAMTINKSQEQTLSNVSIYLPPPIFDHGKLYGPVSCVWKRSGLKILVSNANRRPMKATTNVVFKEVFHNVK